MRASPPKYANVSTNHRFTALDGAFATWFVHGKHLSWVASAQDSAGPRPGDERRAWQTCSFAMNLLQSLGYDGTSQIFHNILFESCILNGTT
jgi:hypothetical protein